MNRTKSYPILERLPTLLLIALLLITGGLALGCGSKNPPADNTNAAEAPAAGTTDPKPIFESDFESGTTDDWTKTQQEGSGEEPADPQ